MKRFINLKGNEKGQSFIILAFTFVGFIALLGLAIDLGMVFIERTALKRAIDAAVLSGVTELGNEEEAGLRALEYLNLNGYDLTDSNVYFKGCIRDLGDYYRPDGSYCGTAGCGGDADRNQVINSADFYPYQLVQPNDDDVTNVFWINTYRYQSTRDCGDKDGLPTTPPLLGDANKLVVTGTVQVDMSFMNLLGRPAIAVTDHAIAQNLDSIDAAIVLDRSGSMEFDPVCYGCWERRDRLPSGDPDYLSESDTATDSPRYSRFYTYPANGVIYRLGLTDGFTNTNRIRACTTDTYDADGATHGPDNVYTFDVNDTVYTSGSNHYAIIEAELYSLNPNPADPELQASGKGYWAFQRGEANYSSESVPYYPSSGTSIDVRGAHMAYHPSIIGSQGAIYGKYASLTDARTGNSPWLEYDFRLYQSAGWTTGTTGYIWARVHAGRGMDVDGASFRDSTPSDVYWALTPVGSPFPSGNTVQQAPQVSDGSSWRWIRITSFSVDTSQPYRFYLFAGSPGYSIDRIVITDNPSSSGNNGNGSALGNARTAPVTAASAYRAACDICNVLYAENITDPATQCTLYPTLQLLNEPKDNSADPTFDEWEMPLRKSKEAIKFFITRLDPDRDQVGFAYYSTSGRQKTELACKRAAQTQGIPCTTTSSPISYTNVLRGVEKTRASGGTPTAYGMKDGLEILGFQVAPGNPGNFDTACDGSANSSCSRGGGAQKVLILLTDGNPNSTSYGNGCSSGTAPAWPSNNNASYRCPLEYAQKAAEAGITVYTIGLGFGVDRDWLKEVARLGNGQAYFSASGGDLNIIFNQILSNIYVRLIE